MLFQWYRKLSQHERALMDGRLITYHFYVGGLTLVVLGSVGSVHREPATWAQSLVPGIAIAFGFMSFAIGFALQYLHKRMLKSPDRDAYLATITAVLGRHRFPLAPSLFGLLVVFSIFATALYILAN
ncbi:MAG: hypothetical protein HGA98_02890 [Deltaproteobacteria bacterium]|nr:hypothetical protein [Deltaproteobacteria bacterium]